MKRFLSILAICMITNAVKSQNVFPTTTGSNVGIGTTTPGIPLEVNANDVSDTLLVAGFFGPNNTGVGAATMLRFGTLKSKGNSAEWRYIHGGNDSPSNRMDFGWNSYAGPVFTYTRGGNFGIGTTAPAYLLDVNGGSRLGGNNNFISGINITKGTGSNYGSIGIGDDVLKSNTSGVQLTAIGDSVLINNTTGVNNNAFGYLAMQFNTTGNTNTASGSFTMRENTTANNNTAYGYSALRFNIAGNNNIALGYQAGRYIANGSNLTGTANSIYIGADSKGLNNSDNNSIVIGYNAIGIGANSVVLGNSSIATTVLRGNVGIGTIAPTAQLHSTGTVRFAGLVLNDTATRILVSDTSGKVAYRSISALNAGWNLTGNSGLNASTNFIGTIDSVDLIFKRFNTRSGLIGSTNTSFGFAGLNPSSTGVNNTALGSHTLASNTSGQANTAAGFYSLFSNTTGLANVGLGGYSLYFNTTGSNNMAIGFSSMYNNITGASNTAIGTSSMASNTAGDYNTGVGGASLFANTTGQNNTAIGYWSMRYSTTGNDNVAIGVTALRNNTTGSQNTSLGRQASYLNTAGSGIVAVGYMAGYSSLTGNNTTIGYKAGYSSQGGGNVMLGYQAGYNDTGSNKLYIANSNTATPLIYGNFTSGQVGIGTNKISDTAYKLFVETGIRTRKVKVDAITWADYVFDEDYKLPALTEVSEFIQKNKHLPGVASAAEVQKDGIDIGENQTTLLKKVEELTLYMIELNKNMLDLNNKVKQLSAENQLLKEKLNSSNQ